MYISIFLCIYIHACVDIHICVCVYIYVWIHIHFVPGVTNFSSHISHISHEYMYTVGMAPGIAATNSFRGATNSAQAQQRWSSTVFSGAFRQVPKKYKKRGGGKTWVLTQMYAYTHIYTLSLSLYTHTNTLPRSHELAHLQQRLALCFQACFGRYQKKIGERHIDSQSCTHTCTLSPTHTHTQRTWHMCNSLSKRAWIHRYERNSSWPQEQDVYVFIHICTHTHTYALCIQARFDRYSHRKKKRKKYLHTCTHTLTHSFSLMHTQTSLGPVFHYVSRRVSTASTHSLSLSVSREHPYTHAYTNPLSHTHTHTYTHSLSHSLTHSLSLPQTHAGALKTSTHLWEKTTSMTRYKIP